MSLIFAAVLTTLLIGTTMSASILHKEIEIGHNGVHYKVIVEAEKEHGLEDHSSETEHQEELGKIGIHYQLHDADHSHHHEEEGEHHEVDIHIDLGGDHHSSEEEHHHDEIHHDQKHHDERHILEHPHHDVDQQHHDAENLRHLVQQLAHHEQPHLYGSKYHQILSHEDLQHLLAHQDSGEQELEYNNVPQHHVIGPHVTRKYHVQNYAVGHGHQTGNLLHLHPSHVATPVTIYGGIPRSDLLQFGNAYHQDPIHGQPFVELHDLHHQIDVHHH